MEIILRPTAAPVVPGTDGLRKLRFSPESWPVGKSGALRVCYVFFEEFGEVLLVLAYSKTEKENLSAAEKAAVRALIARHRAGYAQRAKPRHSTARNGKKG